MATPQDSPKTPAISRTSGLTAFGGLDEFQKDMSRMLDRLFHRDPFSHLGLPSRLKNFDLTPVVDVTERPEAYDITVELPGVAEKDVSVTVENDVLTIAGEKKAEKVEDAKNVHFAERHYGSFQRIFSLPPDTDAEKINASFKDGVLKITLSRSLKTKTNARRIDIRTA